MKLAAQKQPLNARPYILNASSGFTLIEIIIVIGILATLFSMGLISIMNIRVITTNTTNTTVFISDFRTQQIKAMTGDTEGRGIPDNYSIKILPSQYVLYHGINYNSSDTSNFVIPTSTGYTLSTTFPNSSIIFASGSGTIVGFTNNQNTVTLKNTSSGQAKTIHFNQYGTTTSQLPLLKHL